MTEWTSFLVELEALETQIAHSQGLMFAFIEGSLVRALAEGDWVLLDEINLAPAELLDCLAGLLDSATGSLTLADRGYVFVCLALLNLILNFPNIVIR